MNIREVKINLKINNMTSRDFCFWLQGHFELAQPVKIDAATTEMIRRHLNLVFVHEIDPSMGDEAHNKLLDEVHNPIQIDTAKHGTQPSSNYAYSSLHGWYLKSEGVPRC